MRCLPLLAVLSLAPTLRAAPLPPAPGLKLALATERDAAIDPQKGPTRAGRDDADDGDEEGRDPAPPEASADERLHRSMSSGIPNLVVGGVLVVNGLEAALFGFIAVTGATDNFYRSDFLSAREQRTVGWIGVAAGAVMIAVGVPLLVKGKEQREEYNRAMNPQPFLRTSAPMPPPAIAYAVRF